VITCAMRFGYFDTTRRGNQSSFLTPTLVSGRRPFRLKFALKALFVNLCPYNTYALLSRTEWNVAFYL